MVTAGFTTSERGYKMASAYFSQNPRGRKIKIGRASAPAGMAVALVLPASISASEVFSITIDGTVCSYTAASDGSDETGDVGTALELLIEAVGSSTASAFVSDTITVTTGAGVLVEFKNWTSNISFEDHSNDRDVAADLDACQLEDSDWYGLCIESTSNNEIVSAAEWAEANGKLFGATTNDTGVTDGDVTDDVASSLKTLGYARTFTIYNGNSNYGFSACAWLGKNFPYVPGKKTWNLNAFSGVAVDSLNPGQVSAILAKRASCYVSISGISVTQGAKLADGNFIDTRHFIDWLQAEIQVRVFALLAGADGKIPFTDKGVQAVVSEIYGALAQGITNGGLAASPKPTVTVPLVADVSTIDRAARNLPDITFTATLAGAIHTVAVSGLVSV